MARATAPTAPNRVLWLIAIIVGILGVLAQYVAMGELSAYANEMILIAFVLLAIGTSFRGI